MERMKLDRTINGRDVFVDRHGRFCVKEGEGELVAFDLEGLRHKIKAAEQCKRDPLNADVVLLLKKGRTYAGKLLGYHAGNGKLRLRHTGSVEMIDPVSVLGVFHHDDPNLPALLAQHANTEELRLKHLDSKTLLDTMLALRRVPVSCHVSNVQAASRQEEALRKALESARQSIEEESK